MEKGLILLAVVLLLLAIFIAPLRWVPPGSMGFYKEGNRTVSVNGEAVVPFIGPYSKFVVIPITPQKCSFICNRLKLDCVFIQNLSFQVEIIYRLDPEGAAEAYKKLALTGKADSAITQLVEHTGKKEFDRLFETDYAFDCDPRLILDISEGVNTDVHFENIFTQSIEKELETSGIAIFGVNIEPRFSISDNAVELAQLNLQKAFADNAKLAQLNAQKALA